MVQDRHSLIVHGLFSTQKKAMNFVNGNARIAITKITVDG